MWIKILCVEYILWEIPTIESTFDVANMVKIATVKDVPINTCIMMRCQTYRPVKNSCLGKWHLFPYLVVPLISARVPLISTRVSAHCQANLLTRRVAFDPRIDIVQALISCVQGDKKFKINKHAYTTTLLLGSPE